MLYLYLYMVFFVFYNGWIAKKYGITSILKNSYKFSSRNDDLLHYKMKCSLKYCRIHKEKETRSLPTRNRFLLFLYFLVDYLKHKVFLNLLWA